MRCGTRSRSHRATCLDCAKEERSRAARLAKLARGRGALWTDTLKQAEELEATMAATVEGLVELALWAPRRAQ